MAINVDLRQPGSREGNIYFMDRPTTVDCEKEMKCWSSLRAFLILLRCYGRGQTPVPHNSDADRDAESTLGAAVTGTIYGYRKGRVTLCVQEESKSTPLLLLEFAIPTYSLVREMASGLLRIALECEKAKGAKDLKAGGLFSEPVWSMFCNGRKVGFAIKRQISDLDRNVLGHIQSVTMGAGVIPIADGLKGVAEDEIMYMRARYERVGGSPDSVSFHMINPDGSPGRLDETEDLINKLPIGPGATVWGALLGAYRIHDNVDVPDWQQSAFSCGMTQQR